MKQKIEKIRENQQNQEIGSLKISTKETNIQLDCPRKKSKDSNYYYPEWYITNNVTTIKRIMKAFHEQMYKKLDTWMKWTNPQKDITDSRRKTK